MERAKLQDELNELKFDSQIRIKQLEADLNVATQRCDELSAEMERLRSTSRRQSTIEQQVNEHHEETIKTYQGLVAQLESQLEAKKLLEKEMNEKITALGKWSSFFMLKEYIFTWLINF